MLRKITDKKQIQTNDYELLNLIFDEQNLVGIISDFCFNFKIRVLIDIDEKGTFVDMIRETKAILLQQAMAISHEEQVRIRRKMLNASLEK